MNFEKLSSVLYQFYQQEETMSILKLEHSFSKEIKESLQDSCRDGEVQYSVNFMCKDGVVSCDHTILASSGNLWKNILMSTKQDTNYIIAPDYNVKFFHVSITIYAIFLAPS